MEQNTKLDYQKIPIQAYIQALKNNPYIKLTTNLSSMLYYRFSTTTEIYCRFIQNFMNNPRYNYDPYMLALPYILSFFDINDIIGIATITEVFMFCMHFLSIMKQANIINNLIIKNAQDLLYSAIDIFKNKVEKHTIAPIDCASGFIKSLHIIYNNLLRQYNYNLSRVNSIVNTTISQHGYSDTYISAFSESTEFGRMFYLIITNKIYKHIIDTARIKIINIQGKNLLEIYIDNNKFQTESFIVSIF